MKKAGYPRRFLVTAYLLSIGCALANASAGTPSDALKEATAVFGKHWSQCGDLWITHEHFPPGGWTGKAQDYYMELKGVTSEVEVQPLTEADGLNGWKWKATVKFSGRVKRIFYPVPDPNTGHDAGWTEWSPALFTWVCMVSKKENQLSIEEDGGELKKDYCERVECSQIPQRPGEAPAPVPLTADVRDSATAFAGERFPQTRTRVLTADEVNGWSDTDLRYASVEMFARYGDPKAARIFSRFSWYRERHDLTDDQIDQTLFSNVERQNAALLFRIVRNRGLAH